MGCPVVKTLVKEEKLFSEFNLSKNFQFIRKASSLTTFLYGKKNRCTVPFSECITEDHKPGCFCKEGFLGNGTESCVPQGFNVEANKVRVSLDS